ncbi:SGNH/GDSL hydrolase family protein [Lacticaseibacillus suihuaensis]
MILETNSKVLFVGDSVTDAGRDYQALPGTAESLGDGYPTLISAALTAIYPERRIMVENQGVNGNTTASLVDRWQTDVLDRKPDYVTILIGINDVWRHFDSTFYHPNDLVSSELYTKNLSWMIDVTQPHVKALTIMSPFMFIPQESEPMRQMVDQYRQVAESLAAKNHCHYLDIQAAIDAYLQHNSSYILSADRVHPNIKGHMLITAQWLKAIGFDWTHTQA